MSRVFAFVLGKGKEELEAMLKEVQAKITEDPMNESLKQEEAAIYEALKEC